MSLKRIEQHATANQPIIVLCRIQSVKYLTRVWRRNVMSCQTIIHASINKIHALFSVVTEGSEKSNYFLINWNSKKHDSVAFRSIIGLLLGIEVGTVKCHHFVSFGCACTSSLSQIKSSITTPLHHQCINVFWWPPSTGVCSSSDLQGPPPPFQT